MRTSHAHCLLCLNYNHGGSHRCTYTLIHEAGIFICYRLLWQHCLSGGWACSSLEYIHLHSSACAALTSAADGAAQTHPSSLVPSYASGFLISLGPPALSSDRLTHFSQTVGHSPRAKGKHDCKVEHRPVTLCHTSPGEVSAGHSWGGSVG